MQTYNPAEVAAILHRTEKTVRRWLKKGMIPEKKIGRLWYVEEDALKRCLDRSGAISQNARRRYKYHP